MRINYTPKAYLQVIAYQPKSKPDTRPLKQPTITFENDYGPKLGPHHSEPRVKHIDSKKERQYKQNKQPQSQSPEPKQVVYHTTDVYPDIYDNLAMRPSDKLIVGKEGIIMPKKRRPPTKKPVKFDDSGSSSESESEILYGDL